MDGVLIPLITFHACDSEICISYVPHTICAPMPDSAANTAEVANYGTNGMLIITAVYNLNYNFYTHQGHINIEKQQIK
jgi:hypothetical protein